MLKFFVIFILSMFSKIISLIRKFRIFVVMNHPVLPVRSEKNVEVIVGLNEGGE